MTASTTATAADLLTTLNFTRGWLGQLLEDIPADQMLHQVTPGGNHPLWIIGHLAWSDDFFRAELDGSAPTTPPAWKDLFGMGSEPTTDASRYPSVDELRQALDATRTALLDWFGGMDEAKLSAPLPDDWTSFAPTYGALVHIIAVHEAAHVGQLTVVRKSLGLKPVRG